MNFDLPRMEYGNNSLQKLSSWIFSILVLLLSPNYIMQLFPFFKYLWIVGFVVFFIIFIFFFRKIKINFNAILLLFFFMLLFFSSVVGFVRYDNLDGIYFSLGMMAKFVFIYLFLMSIDIVSFIYFLKTFIFVFLVICLHSLVGWFLFSFGFIGVTSVSEIATYYYNIISIWGGYTVSVPLGWGELIRNQSYFQEPGAFAFYIFVIMVLLNSIKNIFHRYTYNIIYFILFLTMLSTLSATGILLSILLSLFIFKSKVLNISFAIICALVLSYIIFSDNPYLNKMGSFEERLYGFINGVGVFERDPLTLLFGAGYNSEKYFGFLGKFNNFIFEIILYSGFLNLMFFLFFLFSLFKLDRNFKFFYFLVLVFCATTPLFWSPIMLFLNLFILRYLEVKSEVS